MELSDSQYDNELLNQIAEESPTFRKLVEALIGSNQVIDFDCYWLGSLVEQMPATTQVQLIVTSKQNALIDEN